MWLREKARSRDGHLASFVFHYTAISKHIYKDVKKDILQNKILRSYLNNRGNMDRAPWYLKENNQQVWREVELIYNRDNIVLHRWKFDRLEEDHNQSYYSSDNISNKANGLENIHPPHSYFFFFLKLLLIKF